MMKIICVTSSWSDIGKTTVVGLLLSRLKGWAAVKLTTCKGIGEKENCHKHSPCGVCSSLKKDYEIGEEFISSKRGKDTDRFLEAGAEKVLWVKSRPHCLKEAIAESLEKLKDFKGVIFEGNHSLFYLEPDVSFMVASGKYPIKESALDIADKIDIFLVDKSKIGLANHALRRLFDMAKKSPKTKVSLEVNSREIPLNEFVNAIFADTIFGMVKPLKGVQNPKKVCIKVSK